MKDIALAFPVFNGLKYTKDCLASIYEFKNGSEKYGGHLQVIIIDDGSSDGSWEWIKSNYPEVVLLKGNGNLWWSGGINKAVEHVLNTKKFDYLLLWNNDIEPAEDYFENLFLIAENLDPNKIILSKVYFKDRSGIIMSMGGVFNPVNGKYFLRAFGENDSEMYFKEVEADWFGGMGTLIPYSVVSRVGYFDEKRFPQYHGDSDYGLRARKLGYKLIVNPDLRIFNDRTKTGLSNDNSFASFLKSLTSIKSNHNIKRLILFYLKHGKSPLVILSIIKHYYKHIGGYLKWLLLGFVGKKRTGIR